MSATPEIEGPKRVDAEVFHQVMSGGRNNAVLLGARGGDGEMVQCVTKLPGMTSLGSWHPVPSLLEWMGCALAAELGVISPPPYEVVISREFADGIPDRKVQIAASKSLGSVFGSGFVQGAQVTNDLLDASMRTAAATIVAFDVFIHNVDRRVTNQNLLFGYPGRNLVAIDHGEAFAFLVGVAGGDPVTDSMFSMLATHALASWARQKGPADLSEFRARLRALDDERFEQLADATPASWKIGQGQSALERILDILRRRRDAVEQWLPPVEAWMER